MQSEFYYRLGAGASGINWRCLRLLIDFETQRESAALLKLFMKRKCEE